MPMTERERGFESSDQHVASGHVVELQIVKAILIHQPQGLRRRRPTSDILLMLRLDSQQLSTREKVGTRIDQDVTIRAQEDQVLVAIDCMSAASLPRGPVKLCATMWHSWPMTVGFEIDASPDSTSAS